MIWSKKHKLFQQTLAGSLKSHLSLRTTGYRDAYEERGRTWFEYDGREVLTFCDFRHENAWRAEGGDLGAVAHKRIFAKSEFGLAMGKFFEMSIEDALRSEDPLILALAVIDRRVGKRRLNGLCKARLGEPADTLLRFRLLAENMKMPNEASQDTSLRADPERLTLAAEVQAADGGRSHGSPIRNHHLLEGCGRFHRVGSPRASGF